MADFNNKKRSREEGFFGKSKKNRNLNFASGKATQPWLSDQYESVHVPNKGRPYTVSIAIPVTMLDDTCLLDDIRSYLIGQISRSAAIFSVDEIIIYNDQMWKKWGDNPEKQKEFVDMMYTVLHYQECPQYLRKSLCPISPHLSKAGFLVPISAPHHLKVNQWCPYREGVIVSSKGRKEKHVNVGIGRNVTVKDLKAPVGARVTVKLPDTARVLDSPFGELVSPTEPRVKAGLYWGYDIRIAASLAEIFNCPNDEEYDYIIGTSDKGDPVDEIQLKEFKKALIVFGGVDGLENSFEKEPAIEAEPKDFFEEYINVCPHQTSRTIRTEEAVPLVLASLCPKMRAVHKL